MAPTSMVQEVEVQGWCGGLKAVLSRSSDGTSYSVVQTLLLQDVLFSHNAQHHRQMNGQRDRRHYRGDTSSRNLYQQLVSEIWTK